VKLGLPPERAKQEQILRVSENRVLRIVQSMRRRKGQEDGKNGIITAS
jgi:hypothetical protein